MKSITDIIEKLEALGLSNLNSRPFDGLFSALLSSSRKLVVVGFNGSDADLKWTNRTAIEYDYHNPGESNIEKGARGEWLSTTLPDRLLSLPNELGFDFHETVYTNAVLLCSENANKVKSKAKDVGFSNVGELVNRSLDFFQDITIGTNPPEVIICYSNSMSDLSAASAIYNRFGVNEISISNNSFYYKTFSFMSEINGNNIPVICIRHMSRYKPCIKSIKEAWKMQERFL